MEKPSGAFLVVCGLEGVLTPRAGAAAQPCDLAAARLYSAVGGKLAVFTHRCPAAARAALGGSTLTLPVATCGGAMLYDLNKNCMVQARTITVQASRSILQFALSELPDAGVLGVDDHGQTCLLRANRAAQALLDREGGSYQLLPAEAAGLGWCKLTVCGSERELTCMRAFLASRDDLPVSVIRQDADAIEMVAAQVQPRETIRRLCSIAGCSLQETAAIIAQHEDIPWAVHTGSLIVMKDAPDELRRTAAQVLGYYDMGGLGEYLFKQAAAMQGAL